MAVSTIYIRIHSHRARSKVYRIIGARQNYYSFERSLGRGGCVQVTAAELETLQAARIKGWSRLRGATDDIRECISWS